ncbi:MAG: putative dsRNA-binding protein, partial [Clostridiales bacterium]
EGIVQAENFVKNQFEDDLHHLSKEDYEDKKSLLQELIQKSNLGNIAYRLLRSSGPDHAKIFVSGVYCGKILLAEGQGNSKKESEQEAAKAALLTMDQWKPFLEEEKLLSSHKQKCNLNCKDCQQEKEKVNKISLKSKSKNRKNRKKINEHGNNLLISYDLNNHNAKKKNKKQEFANISTTRPNKNYFYDEMANKAAMVNENVKD